MTLLVMCSFLALFRAGFLSVIKLTAPTQVRVGEIFRLNCTSSSIPLIQSAEFLSNGRTLTNIGSRDNNCYNAVSSDTCVPVVCYCSRDRRTYIYHHQLFTMKMDVFTCKMKISGTELEVSNNITIDVVEPPVMILNDSFHCNDSESVTLACEIRGGSKDFGFFPWEHYFNGTFIRQLNGFYQGKLCILQINSCNFQDAGKYICKSWNVFSDGIMKTNITTKLLVAEKPMFINKTTHLTAGMMFVVYLYSTSDIVSVHWYLDSQFIGNTSDYVQETEYIGVDITIHGRLVHTHGFRSSLKCPSDSYTHQKYTVCATNMHGKVCDYFEDNTEKQKNTNLFWIIGGIVAALLCLGVVTVISIMLIKNKTQVYTSSTQGDTGQSEPPGGARFSTNQTSNSNDVSQYVQANPPVEEVHSYHRASYVSEMVDTMPKDENIEISAFNTYLEVQPDSDCSSSDSDAYEKVD